MASKLALFFGVRFERRKVDKKQTYMKTETCKLYSRDFWIFLPQIIKKSISIILSYTVSKLVHFFETQCSCYCFNKSGCTVICHYLSLLPRLEPNERHLHLRIGETSAVHKRTVLLHLCDNIIDQPADQGTCWFCASDLSPETENLPENLLNFVVSSVL